uniref:Uncharacterized protein n=1 Tax=Panagrolaimus superbus TaxID=310955 RepID=A0A914XY26_9BILA
MCGDIFGPSIDTPYITQKVEESAYHFGNPWNYTATNVVLPNGGYDPWSALGSKVKRMEIHQIAVTTPRAAHCSDMYPTRKGEPPGLESTRTIIQLEVDYYFTPNTINNNT